MNHTSCVTEGKAKRDRVLSHLERRKRYLWNLAARTAVELALVGKTFTSDDVREALKLPLHVKAQFLGAVFARLRKSGVLRAVGMRPSRLPQCHARNLPLWGIASSDAGREWLANNPPLSDPPAPHLFDGLDDWGAA